MRPRRVLLGIALAVATTGLAAASTLDVSAGSLSAADAAPPCPGTAVALAAGGTLTVTLPSDACAGLPLQVTTLTSAGTPVGAGSATVAGRTAVVSVATAGAAGAVATVNGWALPLAWSSPGPIYPSTPDVQLTGVTWDLPPGAQYMACFTGTVTTTSATPIPWALTVDLSQPPFNGVRWTTLSIQGDNGQYRIAGNQPSAGFAQVYGRPRGDRETIVAGQSYEVRLCDWSLPAAPDTPTAYSVSSAPGTLPLAAPHECVETTISANGTSQFYVGWTAQVDMTAAVARLADSGYVANGWAFSQSYWSTDHVQTGASTFAVTSGLFSSVAGTGTFAFTVCAVAY